MSAGRRFLLAVVGIAALTVLGALGFMLIEGMSVIDAVYMAVITISTVGFGEVKPLSPVGRLFTIGLIVTGVGTAFYLLVTAAELVIEGRLREFLEKTAMDRKIHQLEGHVIICGFGRFGRVVAEELTRNNVPVAVIDSDAGKEAELSRLGMLYVIGSALEDEVLERAAIRTARAIVVATASDADNVYITLSAREKNPGIQIHARGESEPGLRRLRLAGADRVISAYQWGGMRIAASIVRPSVVDFLESRCPVVATWLTSRRSGSCRTVHWWENPSRPSSREPRVCASWRSSAAAIRFRSFRIRPLQSSRAIIWSPSATAAA